MDSLSIGKLSKAKQMKLLKGGSIRIEKGDTPILIHPSRINEITRKFKRGVGHTLSLSPEELHHNIEMKGGSFSDMAKSVFKTGVKMAAPVVKNMARAAIGTGSAMLAAAQPELIPFIPGGAMALTAASDHLFDHAGEYADKMMPDEMPDAADYGAFDHPAVQAIQNKVLNDPRFAQASQQMSNPYHGLNEYMGTNHGFQHDAGYGTAHAGLMNSANELMASKSRQHIHHKHAWEIAKSHLAHHHTKVRGSGLSNKIEKGSVCIGGNLIQHFGQVPQALTSQPYAVNFSSRAFVNPAFQSLIR